MTTRRVSAPRHPVSVVAAPRNIGGGVGGWSAVGEDGWGEIGVGEKVVGTGVVVRGVLGRGGVGSVLRIPGNSQVHFSFDLQF